ncbi:MAG: S-layer homology domain-containing protein [Dysosmobacter welbionis]
MEGVRSSAFLDQSLRAEPVYGLTEYACLPPPTVWRNRRKEDQVLCVLSYVRPGEEDSRSRTITVDARTGAVQEVFSYAPGMEDGETPALTQAEAQVKAETFLSALCGGRWSALTLYDGRDNTEDRRPYYTFTYVQQVGGIPFPENRYTVAIDSGDGSVCRLDYQYDEDVTFAGSAGIVGETAALAAWAGTYDTVLAYRLVPRPLESGDETEARLMELGLTHFYELRLTYALEREERYLGIDAATGKPAAPESGDTAITYTDLSGSGVKADVEKLARYGVGYDGGRFRPDKQLTQWDLVALLASLEGYCIDPETADESTRDTVYSMAYRMGILPREPGMKAGRHPRAGSEMSAGLRRLWPSRPASGHLHLHIQRRCRHPGGRPGLCGHRPGAGHGPGSYQGTGQPPGASWPPCSAACWSGREQTRAPERARRMMEFGRNYT